MVGHRTISTCSGYATPATQSSRGVVLRSGPPRELRRDFESDLNSEEYHPTPAQVEATKTKLDALARETGQRLVVEEVPRPTLFGAKPSKWRVYTTPLSPPMPALGEEEQEWVYDRKTHRLVPVK